MKKVVVAFFCLSLCIAASAQDAKPAVAAPPPLPGGSRAEPAKPDPKDAGKFKFEEEMHDFGEVLDGPPAECDFEFKNVGKSPIIITEAHGTCGCTVPLWPKEPVLPKHKAVIHVTYNTRGRVGPINKDVIITSNAQQNPMKLHLMGMVKPNPALDNKPPLPPEVPPAPGAIDK